MSCCGHNEGCKMTPDSSLSEKTKTETETETVVETVATGVEPEKANLEGSEKSVGAKTEGCKCGPNCNCDPCNC